MKNIITCILTLFVSSNAFADIFYDWVSLFGSGPSSGFIRFADTNIVDPENFDVRFNTTNVLEVQFIFSDGVSITDAVNFDPATTLQNDPSLNKDDYHLFANGGVINTGWTFLKGPGTPALTFVDATDGNILCVTSPCLLSDNQVTFTGPLIPRASSTGEWHLRPVPLPAPVVLLASAFGMVVTRIRRRGTSG